MRFLLWICICSSLLAKPLDVKVGAQSAILMNAETGKVLFEKHAHIPRYPASTTKIATALFILDQKKPPLDEWITVSAEAMKMKNPKNLLDSPSHWLEIDGSKMGLLRGEILSREALFYGLMMVSGNDAANVLAESVSGTVPDFMEELNAYVRSIGCNNTQFQNPHGLHHPEHYTTAYDLCLIMKKAIQFPKFREFASTPSYMKQKTNKQPKGEIKSLVPLIKPGKNHYSKAIAAKTGFHSAAANNLVAAATHEGRTLVVVVMGCENRVSRNEDAIRLFETAFSEKKETRRLMGPETVFSQVIEGSKDLLRAGLTQDIVLEYFPSEDPNPRAFLNWEVPPLPIRKGEKVGEVKIIGSDQLPLKILDLVALQEVKGTFFYSIKQKIKKLFE